MGCDIHFYVEKQDKLGNWTPAVQIVDMSDEGDEFPCHETPRPEQWYNGRNYDLFSILADVRNGFGFAGVSTGDGFVPIAKPKGVPADASEEYKKVVEEWGPDGHSHSWLTVKELLCFDWTQTTRKTGTVDLAVYEDWTRCEYWGRECGEGPRSYSGSVMGGGVKHVDNQSMDKLAARLRGAKDPDERDAVLRECRSVYTQVEWVEPYYQAAGEFWSTVMPRLCKLGRDVHDWERARIVFFFDN